MKECELGPIVNRELQQRVRPVNGVTAHKTVSKADVKHCAKIVQNFDKKWNLWEDSHGEKKDAEKPVRESLGYNVRLCLADKNMACLIDYAVLPQATDTIPADL